MKPYNRETLELHRASVETTAAAHTKAQADRDRFIRGMVDTDWHPTEIAEAAGISRERVYQIRSGVRTLRRDPD